MTKLLFFLVCFIQPWQMCKEHVACGICESTWHGSHQWISFEDIYIYSFYVLVCLHTELHMVELHENTNINRNEQLEHVSCSIIVSSFCFGSTDVQGHKQCSGTQQNSGFAIQHVSTFMLTVVKKIFHHLMSCEQFDMWTFWHFLFSVCSGRTPVPTAP